MKEFSATPAPTGLEVEQLTPYLRQLLIFICVASFFEACDVIIINGSLVFPGVQDRCIFGGLGQDVGTALIGKNTTPSTIQSHAS